MDEKGEVAIAPQYSGARPFQEGLAGVPLEGEAAWGFIDKKGNVKIPAQDCEGIRDFTQGRARLRKDHRWWWIDKSGTPLPYEKAKEK